MAKAIGSALEANPAAAILSGLASELGEFQKAIQSVVGTIQQFVAAIAPSVVLEFNQAMKNLQATIGSAFAGALQIVSNGLREIGGILLPAMQKLTPIVNTLANAFTTTLTGAVRVVASVLEAIAPVFEVVALAVNEVAKLLTDLGGVLSAAFKVAADLLATFLGGNQGAIKDVFKSLADIIRQAVKSLVTFVATLAVFAGAKDTVGKFGDALAKEARDREARAAGLVAAGQNPQITDILALAKQQQQASLIATGAGGARERTDTDWLKSIAESVKATTQKDSFQEALKAWWNESVRTTWFGTLVAKIDAAWNDIKAFFSVRPR